MICFVRYGYAWIECERKKATKDSGLERKGSRKENCTISKKRVQGHEGRERNEMQMYIVKKKRGGGGS